MSDSTDTYDPAARSYTALFVLLGKLPGILCGTKEQQIVYPVNRPGQNTVECYSLATLVFVMLTGFFIYVFAQAMGLAIWSYVFALPLAVLATFVSLHGLFFGFSLLYRILKSLHFFPPSAPEQLPVGVYLLFFTAFAVLLLLSGKWVLGALALPWLIGSVLNFFSAIILFARSFVLQLGGGEQ